MSCGSWYNGFLMSLRVSVTIKTDSLWTQIVFTPWSLLRISPYTHHGWWEIYPRNPLMYIVGHQKKGKLPYNWSRYCKMFIDSCLTVYFWGTCRCISLCIRPWMKFMVYPSKYGICICLWCHNPVLIKQISFNFMASLVL